MGDEQRWAATAQATLDGMLEAGERAVEAVAGTDPKSVTADKAAGAAESVVRGLGTSQAKAHQRAQQSAGTGARLVALTTKRLAVFDRGELTASLGVGTIRSVAVKRALSNSFRRVLTVKSSDGQSIGLEGDRAQVELLAKKAAALSPGGSASLQVESAASVLAMAPMILLLLFGGLFLLNGVLVSFSKGIGTGIIPIVIGGVMLAGGVLLLMRRRKR